MIDDETFKRRMAELRRKMHADIERTGRSVMCVFGGEDTPPFAYTIGNYLNGLPDLLVIGLHDGSFLNDLSQKMIERGAAFSDGELIDLGGKHPVKVITATDARARADYTIQAGRFYGFEHYALQQVLIPDKEGRFPDNPDCAQPYAAMPVLGQGRH